MAYQDDLISARANVAANLKALTANPKPSYDIDGKRYEWQQLFDSYNQQLEAIDKAIQRADGPFQIATRAIT